MDDLRSLVAVPAVEVAKSQKVRLFDVFVLGPFMIAYALSGKKANPLARLLLGAAGIGTIAYNYRNYRMTRASSQ